jgi:hypothetical protein
VLSVVIPIGVGRPRLVDGLPNEATTPHQSFPYRQCCSINPVVHLDSQEGWKPAA